MPAAAEHPAPAARLLAWLRERQSEMVELAAGLARLESPSGDPERVGEVLQTVGEELAALGFAVHRWPGRQSAGQLYARPAHRMRGRPVQLLLGHADTVWPAGTLEHMPVEVREGLLRGPGTYDMKAGIVQMVYALRALAALLLDPPATPVVLLNSDEEIGSPESAPRVERLARASARALVLEPSLGAEGRLKTARKGVGRFRVHVAGRAAHAGLDPEQGISAILELARVVQELTAMAEPERGVTVNVGEVHGGVGFNVIPAQARAHVEVRVRTRADAERLERALRSLRPETPGAEIRVEGGFARPPMEPTAASRALFARARALADSLGLRLDEAAVGGASDGNLASRWTPTLDGLGAVGEGAHAPHEQVRTDTMPERAALLALLLLEPPDPGDPKTAG